MKILGSWDAYKHLESGLEDYGTMNGTVSSEVHSPEVFDIEQSNKRDTTTTLYRSVSTLLRHVFRLLRMQENILKLSNGTLVMSRAMIMLYWAQESVFGRLNKVGRLPVPLQSLNLLQTRLPEPRATIFIPFDDRVLIIGPLNGANFSIRCSEVSQTFDTVSGMQFLPRIESGAKRRSFGAF